VDRPIQTVETVAQEKRNEGYIAVLQASNTALRGIIAAKNERLKNLEAENARLARIIRENYSLESIQTGA
jgi:hypothetical protein